jgi:5-methylcytosine-specific restriction endonuclease McrA
MRQSREEYDRRYLLKNPEKRKASVDAYNQKPETKARRAEWIKANRARYAASKAKWSDANPDYVASNCAKRRSKKLKATPCWLTPDDFWMMREAYKLAKLRAKITGGRWEVDHIVPLLGENVSGLHVPWNLQVILEWENKSKGNKWQS